MRNLASRLLIISGLAILFISVFVLWRRNDPSRLQFNGVDYVASSSENLSEPVGIAIESLNLKLPVVPAGKQGDIEDATSSWETTSEGVSYLTLSPKPGSLGNSIMYGHNWGSILGNLYRVRPGQKIEIFYSDGTARRFEISGISEVSPDDKTILENSTDARITLYTCSGIFDEKRLVVTALLI